MRTAPTLVSVAWLALASCSPKDVIPPAASTHPANPAAPSGQQPAATAAEQNPPGDGAADPHAGHGGGSEPTSKEPAEPKPTAPADPHAGHGGAKPAAPAAPPADPHAGHGAAAPVKPGAGSDKDAIATAERTAYERAKPIFEKHCGRCHSSSGKKAKKKTLGHFSIDTYPFGGHHAAEVGQTIRVVLGVTGKEPTMPMDDAGAVKGAELETLVEWSKAFDASHAAGLHQHDASKPGGHGGH